MNSLVHDVEVSIQRSHGDNLSAASLRVKPAIVSCAVPPATSGQAIVLYRLLNGLPGNAYCLISTDRDSATADLDTADRRLSTPLYPLPVPARFRSCPRYIPRRVWSTIEFISAVIGRSTCICAVARAEHCDSVIGCTGDILDLPAAFLAACRLRLPFYAYTFDLYSFQEDVVYSTPHRVLTYLEHFILTWSNGVIVPNEFLRDEYRSRYRVDPVIVRNPIDAPTPTSTSTNAACERRSTTERRDVSREVRIVYTGSVYQAQFDAFRNLIVALETLDRPNVRLHIYTSQSPAALAVGGLTRSFTQHEPVSLAVSRAIQREADILFLPLAFDSPYPEIIKTSAPGKLGEYLDSGRPILAHAPADSFLAWYFKKHECGLIVDRPDPELLRQALKRLTDDAQLCNRLITNARACAADFQVERARSAFFAVIGA
ncbi:MAG: glycosyltransferase [Planctomycetia bacterium]|nr:glycosyltransferase [Planctomycetia bacterium]